MTNRIEVGRKWLVGVTLTVAPAVVVAIGLDVTLTDQEPIGVQPAVVAVAGLDVPLIDAEPISVSPAVVATVGQMVEITEANEIGVSPATVVVTGQDVALIEADIIDVTAGTVVVAGQDVALTEQERIDVTPAPVAVTGLDAALTDAEPIAVTAGVVAVTGLDVSLTDDATIPVIAAIVGVTGLDVAMGGDIPVSPAIVGVTGLDVAMGGTIPVVAGTVGIVGQEVSLSDADTIDVTAGVVAVTGLDVSLTEAEIIDVTAGVVGVSTSEISLVEGEPIAVTAGVVAVTGLDVDLTSNIADITISSAGPQAANGDIPISYTITFDDATVEVIVFEDTEADPGVGDFDGGGAPTYIDLGTVNMTTTGSDIEVDVPDDLDGGHKFAFLPTNGGAADIRVTGSIDLTSSIIDVTAGVVAVVGQNVALTEGAIIDVTAGVVAVTGLDVDLIAPSSGATDSFDTYTVGQTLESQANYSASTLIDSGTGVIDIISGDAIQIDAIDSGDAVQWDGVDPGSDDCYLELDVIITGAPSANVTRIQCSLGDVEFRAIGTGSVQMRQPIGSTLIDSDGVTWTGSVQTLRFERDVTNSQVRQLLDGVEETIGTGMSFGAGATNRVWHIGISMSDVDEVGDITINEIRTGAL